MRARYAGRHRGAPGRTRTCNIRSLRPATLPIGPQGQAHVWRRGRESNPQGRSSHGFQNRFRHHIGLPLQSCLAEEKGFEPLRPRTAALATRFRYQDPFIPLRNRLTGSSGPLARHGSRRGLAVHKGTVTLSRGPENPASGGPNRPAGHVAALARCPTSRRAPRLAGRTHLAPSNASVKE